MEMNPCRKNYKIKCVKYGILLSLILEKCMVDLKDEGFKVYIAF